MIHFVNIGGDPTVLVNNTSYPLEIEELEDGDKAVTLDKYQTKPTRITDDELYSLSYDKRRRLSNATRRLFRRRNTPAPFTRSPRTKTARQLP